MGNSLPKPTHAIFYRNVGERNEGVERAQKAHDEYLASATRTGVIVMSGPWRDEPGEMTLIRVRTDEQAEEFLANDPAVKAGFMVGEIKAWKVNIISSGAAVGR